MISWFDWMDFNHINYNRSDKKTWHFYYYSHQEQPPDFSRALNCFQERYLKYQHIYGKIKQEYRIEILENENSINSSKHLQVAI